MKYPKNLSVVSWIRRKAFAANSVSVIWKGFLHTLSWVGCGLTWKVGNGEDIRVGIDQIMGTAALLVLPQYLHDYLEDYGIITLAQARNFTPGEKSYWFTAEDLEMGGEWGHLWNKFITGLEYGRIRLTHQKDSLI